MGGIVMRGEGVQIYSPKIFFSVTFLDSAIVSIYIINKAIIWLFFYKFLMFFLVQAQFFFHKSCEWFFFSHFPVLRKFKTYMGVHRKRFAQQLQKSIYLQISWIICILRKMPTIARSKALPVYLIKRWFMLNICYLKLFSW